MINKIEKLPIGFKGVLTTKGIDQFNEAVKEWERKIEDIFLGINCAQTKEGLCILPQDYDSFINEFNKLIESSRRHVEHGKLIPGLYAKFGGKKDE